MKSYLKFFLLCIEHNETSLFLTDAYLQRKECIRDKQSSRNHHQVKKYRRDKGHTAVPDFQILWRTRYQTTQRFDGRRRPTGAPLAACWSCKQV
jgi:hypothetical protein